MNVPECDLLCVGAGPEQIPGISAALDLGFTVLALDGDAKAPGLGVATHGLHVDLRDANKVTAIARATGVRAIIPVPLGQILMTSGHVNSALRLPGLSAQAAHLCTDKAAMRQALSAAGLAQPHWRLTHSLSELAQAVGDIGYPVVIKPRTGSGSRNVQLVHAAREFELYQAEIDDPATLATGLMVESVLPGVEYGVDGAVAGTDFKLIGARRKTMSKPPYRVALSYTGPVRLSASLAETIQTTFQTAAIALGLSNCLLHADIMVDEDGSVHIIEMSGRPSGYGLSQVLLPSATGVQPTVQAIKMLLGQAFSFAPTRADIGILRSLPKVPSDVSENTIRQMQSVEGLVELAMPSTSRLPARITSGHDAFAVGHAVIVRQTIEEVEASWRQLCRFFGTDAAYD